MKKISIILIIVSCLKGSLVSAPVQGNHLAPPSIREADLVLFNGNRNRRRSGPYVLSPGSIIKVFDRLLTLDGPLTMTEIASAMGVDTRSTPTPAVHELHALGFKRRAASRPNSG